MEHVRAPTLTRKRADSVAASNASGEETTTQTGETATIFGLAIGLTHLEEANTDVADGHYITLRLNIYHRSRVRTLQRTGYRLDIPKAVPPEYPVHTSELERHL